MRFHLRKLQIQCLQMVNNLCCQFTLMHWFQCIAQAVNESHTKFFFQLHTICIRQNVTNVADSRYLNRFLL